MPVLPVREVIRPAVLSGLSNGRLPDSILVNTPGQAGGVTVRLVAPAARGWRALCGTAAAAGHILKAISLYGSYRPLSEQERLFRERLTPSYLPGRPSVLCGETRYWLRAGMAMAACPGTSWHGWGLAIDAGEERDADLAAEPLDDPTLDWLIAHELDFGFSHELQSEPWHIRWFKGDVIPPAVLAWENDMQLDDVVTGTRTVRQILASVDARLPTNLVSRLDAILAAASDDGNTTVVMDPAAAGELKAIRDALGALAPEFRDAVADLGEGGAAAVRADVDG